MITTMLDEILKDPPKPPPGWNSMGTAPKEGYPIIHVQVIEKDGTIHSDAHWAQDLSGEEQPAFQGWFVPFASDGFREVEPIGWKPITKGTP